MDLLEVVLRRDGTDFEVRRLVGVSICNIPTKTTEGRPSQVYFDRQITPVMNIWPTPDSTDQLIYYYVQRIEDADTLTNTTDMPFRFYPCMVAGLRTTCR